MNQQTNSLGGPGSQQQASVGRPPFAVPGVQQKSFVAGTPFVVSGTKTGLELDSDESSSADGSSDAFRVKRSPNMDSRSSGDRSGNASDETETYFRERTGSNGSERSGSAGGSSLTLTNASSGASDQQRAGPFIPSTIASMLANGMPNTLGPYYLPPTDPNFVAYAAQYENLRSLAAFSAAGAAARRKREREPEYNDNTAKAMLQQTIGNSIRQQQQQFTARDPITDASSASGMAFVDLPSDDGWPPELGPPAAPSAIALPMSWSKTTTPPSGNSQTGMESLFMDEDGQDLTIEWDRDVAQTWDPQPQQQQQPQPRAPPPKRYDAFPQPPLHISLESVSPRTMPSPAFPPLSLPTQQQQQQQQHQQQQQRQPQGPKPSNNNEQRRSSLRAAPPKPVDVPTERNPPQQENYISPPSHSYSANNIESYSLASSPSSPQSPESELAPPTPSSSEDNDRSNNNKKRRRNSKTNKERGHECEVCGKVFGTSGYLGRHKKVHTDSKPHSCPVPGCASTFNRHDNMLQHWRSHIRRMAQQAGVMEEQLPLDVPRPPPIKQGR